MFVGWFKKQFAVLQRKVGTMRKNAVKDQLYGSIVEMMGNRELFYKSNVGKHHEYSHWTEEGKQALMEFLESHSKRILSAEEEDLKSRAKEMTFDALKKS